ncbi:hypothetical protein ACO1K7_14050, partial [Staphylococcus aureus]
RRHLHFLGSETENFSPRPVEINYPGTGNYSQFTYDPLGHVSKIVEFVGGSPKKLSVTRT